MKTKIFAIIAILLLATAVTVVTDVPILYTATAVFLLTLLVAGNRSYATSGLNKEVWLSEVKEGFYGDDSWLMETRDLSAFVENDIINLSEAGVSPDVLIDNTVYPIPTSERTDGAIVLELHRFDTTNTKLKDADRVELAYDKLKSIVYGHKQKLRFGFLEKGAHAIAPQSHTANTPVIASTGADDGTGYKKMTFDDILSMEEAFDELEAPEEGRICVINVNHRKDLKSEDKKLYKEMMKDGEYAGFKIYKQASKRLPNYDTATGAKTAFGSVQLTTHKTASIFYQKDEVMRSVGTDSMYHGKAENDPQNRQDVVGFARRGLVMPIRNKAIGAIYKAAV